MSRWFFYGTLRHVPLLEAVVGRKVVVRDAHLPGWQAVCAKGESFPILVESAAATALGIIVENLTGDDLARLAYYEESFGYYPAEVSVGGAPAQVYLGTPGVWEAAGPWVYGDWVAATSRLATAAAQDYMAGFGTIPGDVAARHYAMTLQRASSRLRAEDDPPVNRVRQGARPVTIKAERQPWLGFFAVAEADLRFGRFDGNSSPLVTRAGFLMGDAVTVLPYDPKRDRVLVVEQFRFGPWLRGDHNPWTLEPIAGRIDPGEAPEDTARREALEEAGLVLGDLILAGRYYPSPGAVSEYLWSYIALADLPDEVAGIGGLASEAEDIKAHLLSFDALMALIATPEASNGPLILTALALARARPGLLP